jgi:hypothetical protein
MGGLAAADKAELRSSTALEHELGGRATDGA